MVGKVGMCPQSLTVKEDGQDGKESSKMINKGSLEYVLSSKWECQNIPLST